MPTYTIKLNDYNTQTDIAVGSGTPTANTGQNFTGLETINVIQNGTTTQVWNQPYTLTGNVTNTTGNQLTGTVTKSNQNKMAYYHNDTAIYNFLTDYNQSKTVSTTLNNDTNNLLILNSSNDALISNFNHNVLTYSVNGKNKYLNNNGNLITASLIGVNKNASSTMAGAGLKIQNNCNYNIAVSFIAIIRTASSPTTGFSQYGYDTDRSVSYINGTRVIRANNYEEFSIYRGDNSGGDSGGKYYNILVYPNESATLPAYRLTYEHGETGNIQYYTVSITAGTGVTSVYIADTPNATSGNAPVQAINGQTVYGFVTMDTSGYSPQASGTQVSGNIYRVGGVVVNNNIDFGTQNAVLQTRTVTFILADTFSGSAYLYYNYNGNEIQITNISSNLNYSADLPISSISLGIHLNGGQAINFENGSPTYTLSSGTSNITVYLCCYSYTYTTGTLPTGVASLTCYRAHYNPNGISYSTISSNTRILKNDRLYFTATASSGYSAPTCIYTSSSNYLTVSSNVTGRNYVTAGIGGKTITFTKNTGVTSISLTYVDTSGTTQTETLSSSTTRQALGGSSYSYTITLTSKYYLTSGQGGSGTTIQVNQNNVYTTGGGSGTISSNLTIAPAPTQYYTFTTSGNPGVKGSVTYNATGSTQTFVGQDSAITCNYTGSLTIDIYQYSRKYGTDSTLGYTNKDDKLIYSYSNGTTSMSSLTNNYIGAKTTVYDYVRCNTTITAQNYTFSVSTQDSACMRLNVSLNVSPGSNPPQLTVSNTTTSKSKTFSITTTSKTIDIFTDYSSRANNKLSGSTSGGTYPTFASSYSADDYGPKTASTYSISITGSPTLSAPVLMAVSTFYPSMVKCINNNSVRCNWTARIYENAQIGDYTTVTGTIAANTTVNRLSGVMITDGGKVGVQFSADGYNSSTATLYG